MCGVGLKLEKIRLHKQVMLKFCEVLFGKAIGKYKKFDYKFYKSSKLRAKVEKLWLLLLSNKEMSVNEQVGFEFIIGIVAEEAMWKI